MWVNAAHWKSELRIKAVTNAMLVAVLNAVTSETGRLLTSCGVAGWRRMHIRHRWSGRRGWKSNKRFVHKSI